MLTMNQTIRWGIIGPGNIARKFATGLQALPDATLLAVASRSHDNAQRFGKEYGVSHRYDSYEALVSDPEVDAVYIATPHTGHYEHTLLCLNHNKAVLCEKPLAINTGQVKKMIALAQEKRLFFMEALWTKFLPSIRQIRKLIAEGAIGEVRTVQADFGFRTDASPAGRLLNSALGGGSVLDIGIYPIFLATTLLGRPTQVKALAQMTTTGVDAQCSMSLAYENGAVATLLSTIVSTTPTQAYIAGSRGSIQLHPRWYAPASFTLFQDGKEPVLVSPEYLGNGYNYEAEEVMHCLREGRTESELMSHSDSLLLMEVMDWVRKEAGIQYTEDDLFPY
jgi:predicted dehydrogenase